MPRQAQPRLWEFDFPTGQIRHGRFSGQIDVGRPELGLHHLRWNASTLPGNILGARWSPPDNALSAEAASIGDPAAHVRDAYIRGCDLVANYQPTSLWPFSSQVYWRADPLDTPEDILAPLLLMISLQTDLLDTHPEIDVHTQLLAEEVLFIPLGNPDAVEVLSSSKRPAASRPTTRSEYGCLLFRLPGGQLSLVEMAHPSDFRQFELTRQAGFNRSNWRLFAHFLEKGVIRRTRMFAACVPRAGDVTSAATCFGSFANSPLPLTA